MANYNQVSYGSQDDDVTELKKRKSYQENNSLDADSAAGSQTQNTLSSKQTTTVSSGVEQAQAQIAQQLNGGSYQSPWQTQLNDAINKILNREKFSYDLNGDALYQQYKDKYITQGQQAMMDTMGQAQAMTGGYGNSYAQMAGQQAYQGYLQQLNDKIPELYQLALSKYQAEGDDLYNQYAVLGEQDNRDYSRYIDDRNFDYQQERDKVADEQWQKEFDEALRQFNFANKLGEFAVQSSGGSGSGVYYNPQPKSEEEGGDDSGDGGGTADGFTGTTYSEAAAYLKTNGQSAANLMTQSEWQRHKNVNNSAGGEHEASNYQEYLAAYIYDKTGK